jgi:DNA-binding FadR family transcriptional regulator
VGTPHLLTESEREKVRSTAQTEQLNLLGQSNSREDSPQAADPLDPWMEEENLRSMAQDLENHCSDRETLASLRRLWHPSAMNAAFSLLSAEKHAQIKQWVLELNQSAAGD